MDNYYIISYNKVNENRTEYLSSVTFKKQKVHIKQNSGRDFGDAMRFKDWRSAANFIKMVKLDEDYCNWKVIKCYSIPIYDEEVACLGF